MEDHNNSNQQFEANDAPSQNNASEPVFASEKKKTNVLALVLGAMALVFAAVAVFFGVKYFGAGQTGNGGSGGQTAGGVSGGQVADVSATVTAEMAKEYKEVYDLVSALASKGSGRSLYTGESPLTRVNNTNVFVSTKFSLLGKALSSKDSVSAVGSDLVAAGFENIGMVPFVGSAGPEIYGYLDNETSIICNVWQEGEYTYGNGWLEYVYFSCGKTSWTWLTDEETKLIGELGAAFQEKTGKTSPIAMIVRSVSIKDSEYKPYQTLRVSLGAGVGEFYRTGPDSKWQFFTVTQAPIDCSKYDTDDLKKAFLGEVCYNDGFQQSTVQL